MIAKLLRDSSGNIIPIFALCIVVIFGTVGAAIDFSRATATRSQMQAALDATAIMLTKEAAGLNQTQLTARAQVLFLANSTSPDAKTSSSLQRLPAPMV